MGAPKGRGALEIVDPHLGHSDAAADITKNLLSFALFVKTAWWGAGPASGARRLAGGPGSCVRVRGRGARAGRRGARGRGAAQPPGAALRCRPPPASIPPGTSERSRARLRTARALVALRTPRRDRSQFALPTATRTPARLYRAYVTGNT
ncbi:unnamed protein product [Colias eurytheme]|nr:unnamed protein product [Colias eurytheme]